MTDAQIRIHALLRSILDYFETCRSDGPWVSRLLDKVDAMNLNDQQMSNVIPQGSRHDSVLVHAIEGITTPKLATLASCLRAAKDDLIWREDDARYYGADADLGDGYKNCNLHSILIGPDGCGYDQPDFSLGLFMLGPRTLYRDHYHDAPEVYLNLSKRTGWRFKPGDWRDVSAGSVVWNAPRAPHATRVYDHPFLSVFVWLEDINAPCFVIPCDDWTEIESELAKGGRT